MAEQSSSMDDKLARILEKLRVRGQTHPQLCSVWREYLAIKRNKFENDMDNCIDMIDRTNDAKHGDLSVEQIWFLSNISGMLYPNTT